jgi:glycosyltransferase involved in cell wall biosynthesis
MRSMEQSSCNGDPMIAVLIPIFNDWAAAGVLLEQLDRASADLQLPFGVTLVDDGSTDVPHLPEDWRPVSIQRIDLVELHCNLGHQRAIAVGLNVCAQRPETTAVVVMDADGEDSASDVRVLVEKHLADPTSIVVASRGKRSEGVRFTLFYQAYKAAFHGLTGRTVDFGNFCLLPAAAVHRIIHMPESWNHLAATVLRSRLPIERIVTTRRPRLTGRSSMNLESLVTHGFSAISVFSEVVLTRILIVAGVIAGAAALTGLTAGALRLFTNLAIPGWATTVVGFSALLLFQTLSLLAVMIFMSLSSRSSVLVAPAHRAREYIKKVTALHPKP